jgi:ribosome-associated protein YbcJ (S4-like RNA binding protein)/carbon monoxide dehydrogenase subunit G
MSTIEQSIEVAVPVRAAYNQWTQFEEFPRFMEGVEEVRQLDDTHLHWRTKVGGREQEFDAQITEQRPDERIAWTATQGVEQAGVVTFHRVDDGRTKVMLQLDAEPEGAVEKVGDALGVLKRRVKGDLERFKELIEARGAESGAWRGEVDQSATRGTCHAARVRDLPIRGESIRLGQALKLSGLAESGGEARALVEQGAVTVNAEVETRRGRQLRHGDVVALGDEALRIDASP